MRDDAGGQREVGDPQLVADRELAHVDLDLAGDVLGLGLDRQAEDGLLEQTAVAHADRLADEVQRDLGGDRDVGADPDEVDVDQVAAASGGAGPGGPSASWSSPSSLRVMSVLTPWARMWFSSRAGTVTATRVATPAVDDRGHLAGAPQPPRGAGATLGARSRLARTTSSGMTGPGLSGG